MNELNLPEPDPASVEEEEIQDASEPLHDPSAPLTREDAERLIAAINSMPKHMAALRAKLTRVEKRQRVMTGCIGFGALLVIAAVAFVGVWANDAQDAADDAVAAQHRAEVLSVERRTTACVQANVETQQDRNAFKAIIAAALGAENADPSTLSPEDKADYDTFAALVDEQQPFRDCTTREAVDSYYQHPPEDPANPGN